MTKALERRAKLRESLIEAAERRIAAGGLAGLKTRELAREIGCANGAVYNLVADIDELILRVGSRTLGRLDASLTEAESGGAASAVEALVRIAIAYCDFAAENTGLWARSLFSAVHGMVVLGLEQKLIAVPIDALRNEIAIIVRAMVNGLALEPRLTSRQ
jgi:AcrR family transcriptional regulator